MIDVEKLNALVDNELDGSERAEVEKMLAEDTTSAAQVGAIRQMKEAVKDHIQPVHCEDEWKACVKRLNEIDRAKTTRKVVDRWAWAMCSCLFAFICIAGLFNRINPGVRAGTGDISRAGMEKPVRDVYHWIKNEFGQTPTVPQEKLQLMSASQGTFRGRPVADLHLKDSEGPLSLVMMPGNINEIEGVSPMEDGQHFSGQNGDANSVVWEDHGILLVLTAKRSPDDLRDLSTSIKINP